MAVGGCDRHLVDVVMVFVRGTGVAWRVPEAEGAGRGVDGKEVGVRASADREADYGGAAGIGGGDGGGGRLAFVHRVGRRRGHGRRDIGNVDRDILDVGRPIRSGRRHLHHSRGGDGVGEARTTRQHEIVAGEHEQGSVGATSDGVGLGGPIARRESCSSGPRGAALGDGVLSDSDAHAGNELGCRQRPVIELELLDILDGVGPVGPRDRIGHRREGVGDSIGRAIPGIDGRVGSHTAVDDVVSGAARDGVVPARGGIADDARARNVDVVDGEALIVAGFVEIGAEAEGQYTVRGRGQRDGERDLVVVAAPIRRIVSLGQVRRVGYVRSALKREVRETQISRPAGAVCHRENRGTIRINPDAFSAIGGIEHVDVETYRGRSSGRIRELVAPRNLLRPGAVVAASSNVAQDGVAVEELHGRDDTSPSCHPAGVPGVKGLEANRSKGVRVTADEVVADAANDHVVAEPADDPVIAVAAVDAIVTVAAIERVVAATTGDGIVAARLHHDGVVEHDRAAV